MKIEQSKPKVKGLYSVSNSKFKIIFKNKIWKMIFTKLMTILGFFLNVGNIFNDHLILETFFKGILFSTIIPIKSSNLCKPYWEMRIICFGKDIFVV